MTGKVEENNILYDSESNSFSLTSYDSIYISNHLISLFQDDKRRLEFFQQLFSILPINSFYRFLNPIGKIYNSIELDNNLLKKSNNNDITNYIYVINDKNINAKYFNSSKDQNILFNYFTLKNLQTPDLRYNYLINSINEDKSYDWNKFIPQQDEIYSRIKYFYELKENIKKYIYDNKYSDDLISAFIQENSLTQSLINIASNLFINLSKTQITNYFNETEENQTLIGKRVKNSSIMMLFIDDESEYYNFSKSEYLKLLYFVEQQKLINFIEECKNDYIDKFIAPYDQLTDKFGEPKIESLNTKINKSFQTLINKILEIIKKNENIKIKIFNNNEIKHIFKNIDNILKINDNVDVIGKNMLSNIMSNLELIKNVDEQKTNILSLSLSSETKASFNNMLDILTETYSFNNEKQDILSVYNDNFSQENYMKKDGILYGSRKYNKLSKSNYLNKLWISYNYFTSFDNAFINDNNIFGYEISNNSYDSQNNIPFFDILLSSYNDISGKLLEVIPNEQYISINNEYVYNYFKMLAQMKNFEFIDLIEGEYKFKESNIRKSNIYSLRLENTNLNYKLYSYDDIITYVNKEPTEGLTEELIINAGYYKIFDITNNENAELYYKHNMENIPLSSYSFYKVKNNESPAEISAQIYSKMKLRQILESSIRSSIYKYMPVDTQLWKIEYEGI